jgi:hypothetical protein
MAASPSPDALVAELLKRFGRTYAREAGIRLADQPAPLYELLVLATLISARISAEIAVAAARELFAAGYRTPRGMVEASWQDRVDALGRGHYKRYDERTATMLGDGAELLTERWHGDLRRLRDEADGAVSGRGAGRWLKKSPHPRLWGCCGHTVGGPCGMWSGRGVRYGTRKRE